MKLTKVWEEAAEDFYEIVESDDHSNVSHPLVHWIVNFIVLLQKRQGQRKQ